MLTPQTSAEIVYETRANIVLYTLPHYIIIYPSLHLIRREWVLLYLCSVRASLTNNEGFFLRLFCALLDVFLSEKAADPKATFMSATAPVPSKSWKNESESPSVV